MSKFTDMLIHVFLPNRCMFCNEVIEYDKHLCDKCFKVVGFADKINCHFCDNEICSCEKNFSKFVSPFYYDLGVQNAIGRLKFNGNLSHAKKLAVFMVDYLSEQDSIDIVVPVPLYEKDFDERGYNQSYYLAKHVANLLKKPLFDSVLFKIKQTNKQHQLSEKERNTNLQGSFEIRNKETIFNKRVLLIDDVATTGNTLNLCSLELRKAFVKDIICLSAAKTRRKDEDISD